MKARIATEERPVIKILMIEGHKLGIMDWLNSKYQRHQMEHIEASSRPVRGG